MPLGPLLVPRAGLFSGRSFCAVLYSFPAVGFGLLRWSIARYNVTVVQHSRLSSAKPWAPIFCFRTFHVWGFWILTSRFSVSMEVFSQGNPCRRSLQFSRSAKTAVLLTQHLLLVFYLFTNAVNFLITLRFNTLSGPRQFEKSHGLCLCNTLHNELLLKCYKF